MTQRVKNLVRAKLRRQQNSKYVMLCGRTNRHVYAQLQDPHGKVVFGASSLTPELRSSLPRGDNREAAREVGSYFAKKVLAMGIDPNNIAFNRSGMRYAGRVQALADGARDAGIGF